MGGRFFVQYTTGGIIGIMGNSNRFFLPAVGECQDRQAIRSFKTFTCIGLKKIREFLKKFLLLAAKGLTDFGQKNDVL